MAERRFYKNESKIRGTKACILWLFGNYGIHAFKILIYFFVYTKACILWSFTHHKVHAFEVLFKSFIKNFNFIGGMCYDEHGNGY